MDGVAKLITETYEVNGYGQEIASKTEREIFVTVNSVTRTEFFSAGRQNINPELVLTTPAINYEGEEVIEYEERRYSIYRTFTNGEMIELYAQFKVGENG